MEQPYVDTTNVGGNEYKIRDTEIRKILTPEYNTENSYTLDDLVMYEGKLYVCIEENQGIWNDTQWQEITLSEYLDFVNEKYLGLTKKLVQAIGVLENLQTTFKENLVGAVNENKTKIEAVSTDLTSKIGRTYTGSLNDLRTPGLYWCTMANVTQKPADSAGSVEVVTDNGSYVTQVYTALGNNQYIRGRNGATGNWSEWTHLANRDYVAQKTDSIIGKNSSNFLFNNLKQLELTLDNSSNFVELFFKKGLGANDAGYSLFLNMSGFIAFRKYEGTVLQEQKQLVIRDDLLSYLRIRKIERIEQNFSLGIGENSVNITLTGYVTKPLVFVTSSITGVEATATISDNLKTLTIKVNNKTMDNKSGKVYGLVIETV